MKASLCYRVVRVNKSMNRADGAGYESYSAEFVHMHAFFCAHIWQAIPSSMRLYPHAMFTLTNNP